MSRGAQLCIVLLFAIAAAQVDPSAAAAQSESSSACPQPEIQPTARDVTLHYYRAICGISPPKMLEDPDPEWPDVSSRIKHGAAVLWIGIGEDGAVQDIGVVKASRKEFGEKAADAVRRWKFTPATKNGHPVPVAVEVTTTFDR